MCPTFEQLSLLPNEKRPMVQDFAFVYSSQALANLVKEIEVLFTKVDEQAFFRDLVNISRSRTEPYHRWARYREGFSGALVAEMIRRSSLDPKRHFIFDPMCGSGSTLVASAQLGFDSIGSDINSYSVDLSNVKVTHHTSEVIRRVKGFIKKPLRKLGSAAVRPWKRLDECRLYFRPEHLAELQSIVNSINSVSNAAARQLLFVAWLTILEDCSERRKDGNGLATRPSPVRDVWLHFTGKVQMFLQDINDHPLPSSIYGFAANASALDAQTIVDSFRQQTNKELGVVIFSPPYANSFDYFESYKIELLAGYLDEKSLIEKRTQAIRNYRKGYGYPLMTNDKILKLLCEEIAGRIPEKEVRTGKRDNRTRLVPNLLIGYFEDMEKVLRALFTSMVSNSKCHIVVDQSSYVGVIVPTDILLANIAQRIGFQVAQLIYCRKANTSGQQIRQYPYLATMLRESIVSLVRP